MRYLYLQGQIKNQGQRSFSVTLVFRPQTERSWIDSPLFSTRLYMKQEHVLRKPVIGVSDRIRHKPGCTTAEDGWRIEIPDLRSRGIVLSV